MIVFGFCLIRVTPEAIANIEKLPNARVRLRVTIEMKIIRARMKYELTEKPKK